MDNNKNNEVYISYDVEDSLVSSFINYLIAAFNRQGISAFFEGRSSDVEAAEMESEEEERFSKLKVFVVVFSQNHVSHVPRLAKHMYSCRNNNNFVVVPVFYHVSMSYVKQYVENYDAAFKAFQLLFPMLRRCHEYDGKRSEAEFQEEIARDVFENLYPTEEIGIQSSILEIENLLCEQPWGVRTIGIFGVPGIGKTTLARAVFRRISGGYDDSCFFKDFQTEYNEKKLKVLPNKYLSDTPMEKFDLNCSDSEPSWRKKRVLIALDDVRYFQNAKSFLGRLDNFSPGSLIIITSRYKRVLEQCQMNETYELKGLNDEDALKLFARCAFGKDVIEENLLNPLIKAIKRCRGNPSALRSEAKNFKAKATGEVEQQVTSGVRKNTFTRITPYEKGDELQENKEPPLVHNAVLATRYTIDRRFQHQGWASQIPNNLQIYLNSRDLNKPELIRNLSDGAIQVGTKERKLNREGSIHMKNIRPGKINHDPDQANGSRSSKWNLCRKILKN